MNDLISRQVAVDAMRKLPYRYRGIVWDILNSLPSAEPQRKKTERTTPGNLVIGDDGKLVYSPMCGGKYDRE